MIEISNRHTHKISYNDLAGIYFRFEHYSLLKCLFLVNVTLRADDTFFVIFEDLQLR